jgi:tetrahydromethanopterin S-methyltransferase subunit B
MKAKLGTDTPGTYTFDAAAKKVTFSGLRQAITLSNIYLITNSTTNTIIYNFASSAKGNAGFTNNVLTLDFDTTAMSNTDDLQIILDVESLEETLQTLLRRMNKLLESNTVVDSRLRQRVTLDALPTAELTNTVPVSGILTANINTAITTQAVANSATNPYTLGSLSTSAVFEGPLHQLWRVADESRNLYASAIRSKLVFS